LPYVFERGLRLLYADGLPLAEPFERALTVGFLAGEVDGN
jgi:hypothetical protein